MIIIEDKGNEAIQEESYSVYIHTTPDGRKYIGMTRQNVEKRWHGGCGYRNQPKFYDEIQKNGWSNIKHEVVLESASFEEAAQKEKELIQKYETQNPKYGFNTKCGGQTFGRHS